jgi:hypothetical protein
MTPTWLLTWDGSRFIRMAHLCVYTVPDGSADDLKMFGLMFWSLTAVCLGHGFGMDSRPPSESAVYAAALVEMPQLLSRMSSS